MEGDSHVTQLLHREERRDDVGAVLVVDEDLPDRLCCGHSAARERLVQIEHPLQGSCGEGGRERRGGEGEGKG